MFSKIISDSSSNIFEIASAAYASVPLRIHAGEQEYIDAPAMDVDAMVEALRHHKGRSGTSCPNIFDWTQAFGDAENIYCVTISSSLSGSYSAAMQAAEEYMKQHPERRVAVFDSLSTGPEMQLLIEKIDELLQSGMDFDAIVDEIHQYQQHCHILFCLQSLLNLSRNGRVSHAVAKIAGVLGIRIIGKGSEEGTLETLHKSRGERKALDTLYSEIISGGFQGGKLRIAHCQNLESAEALKALVLSSHPESDVAILPCAGLCSFYAERGRLIVAYEGAYGSKKQC